jgi:hypothetical protein
MADTPLRAGYAQALGGYSWVGGPFVRGELGIRPTASTAAYVYGEWNQAEPVVGAGFRWEWDF